MEQKVRWQCPCGAVWPVSRVQEAITCPHCRLVFNVVPQDDYLLLKVTRKDAGQPEARRMPMSVTGLVRKGCVTMNHQ